MSAKKLITLALAAALPLSVWAVPVETAATGKNQEAALKKAEVNAVRNVMLTITDEEFVRGHVSDIRQQIILNSGNLVTGSEILSSESNDSGQTTVRARFEVDRDKMAGIISKIGGGTAETPVTADTANTEPPKTDPETGDTAKTETAGTGTADPAKPEATQAGPEVSPAPTPGADPRIAERWLVTKIARDIPIVFNIWKCSSRCDFEPGSRHGSNPHPAKIALSHSVIPKMDIFKESAHGMLAPP